MPCIWAVGVSVQPARVVGWWVWVQPACLQLRYLYPSRTVLRMGIWEAATVGIATAMSVPLAIRGHPNRCGHVGRMTQRIGVKSMSYITTNILRTDDCSDVFTFYGLPDDERSHRQYAAVRHALDAIGARYAVVTRDETTDDGTTVETSVILTPTVPGLVRLLSMCASYRESYETTRYWSDGVDYWDIRGPVTEEYTIEIVGMSRARLAVIESAVGIRID